jgi:nucleoside-diphosphate-sugar epimerase
MSKQLNSEISQSLNAKYILVTGGAGYLATSLINLLKDEDCSIVRVDKPGASFVPMKGAAQVEDLTADVRELITWERTLEGIDIVYHFAAQTSAYAANENPPADLDINVMPILHLLETCRKKGYRPIVLFASTVTIAGIPSYLPVDETHPNNPTTIYDLHKLMAEQYLKMYVCRGIVRGAILRLANVYGPGPKSSRSDRGILNLMIRKALAGESLSVYKPGDQLRDYVYVEDVTRAFIEATQNIEAVNAQHYIIGSGKGHAIAETMNLVADRVALKTNKRVEVGLIDPPSPLLPIEARNFVANYQRFKKATGWQPSYSLIEGIDHTVESLL